MRPYSKDYNSRQVDIEWLQTILLPRIDSVELALAFSENTKIVTGMQKLVQRFTNVFLTTIGEVKFDTTYGTNFWPDMLAGAAQNLGQVAVVVSRANAQARRIIDADDSEVDIYGEIPLDEQLDAVDLIDFNYDQVTGTLSLKQLITNRAGETYTYVIPVQAVRK